MDIWSLLPPLLALVMVVLTREVISSLATALFVSEYLQLIYRGNFNPFMAVEASVMQVLSLFASPGNARLILFSLSVGALLHLVRESGATQSLAYRLSHSRLANSSRRVSTLSMLTSALLFIESNLSILVSGMVSRDLFDKFRLSRARLAYLLHSFSPPICILILLNGWGAYILGLLGNYEFPQSRISILMGTVPLNFYALFTVALVVFTSLSGRWIGRMRSSEQQAQSQTPPFVSNTPFVNRARYLVIPLAILIIAMMVLMLITGQGNFTAGDGSRSVLYSVMLACAAIYLMLRMGRIFTHSEIITRAFDGMKEMLPLVAILVVSIALGASVKALGTGHYVAGMIGEWLPLMWVIPMLFLAGALISFATGTSWGTFAILIPIGVPLIQTLGLPPALTISAILGGGVFGDHCSPISDTTYVTAMASGCEVFEHVQTQLPYALIAASLTFTAYLIASWVMI